MWASSAKVAELEFRVQVLEAQLAEIARAANVEISTGPPVSDEVRLHVLNGKKILAIKTLRDQYPGLGLVEAKNIIERL